jgi:hypothetical protein
MQYTVWRLAYPSAAARLRLIALLDASQAVARRWLFVDLPSGLEVVVLRARVDLSAWLEGCQSAGMIAGAARAEAPQSLDPRLFFGQPAPAFYVRALAIGSARAARLLLGGYASDQVIGDEILTLYASLMPREAERRRALEHYALWLQAPDGGGEISPGQLAADAEYARLRSAMRTQVVQLAARLPLDSEHARAMVGDALLARLAHTHVVRLCSPQRAGDHAWEANLARGFKTMPTAPGCDR